MQKKATAKKEKAPKVVHSKYVFAVGRRKTAISKVKLTPEGTGEFKVNDKAMDKYFPTFVLQQIMTKPLTLLGLEKKVNVVVAAIGGGISAQAQATSLGISRALIKSNPDFRTVLKKEGLLSRDARKKERKKPGLKRARRAPQWQKR